MPSDKVDLLILGAGWTSMFLIPLCSERQISSAATTRDGCEGTIPFIFDPDWGSERLVRNYQKTHDETRTGFIQLGSTGIWDKGPTLKSDTQVHTAETQLKTVWHDRHSPFDCSNPRAQAETELLTLSPDTPTTVLNLCGLWGGRRHPRNWVNRVAPTKEALKAKGSIHLIHGLDVARAILAVHSQFSKAAGERWLLTDERVYDWWDLASAWGSGGLSEKGESRSGPQPGWVQELMEEDGIKALPRSPEQIGRALDGREFWRTFGLSPVKARLED
ncbi:hypothetical protein GLOTRDRAFT_140193 [Gloeophyllum trabeum ATCC 11539]|uniref:Uncharacterized protein n=1 Tax=Gloeophyllum trabeum (strain ATCC 11539 / FP-39264 / Madison 617) TaxID=670483 RepID=S7RIM0_GLOTA|nr:uncharacterized protein GLOTRDRAFT_140193 [Gloeophyllum trabeum ATCC 11539]EPQ52439.1 hypothetical protein GLOTRDRAFT_140193 [Gloeophyllum trabeum ATCC 11539]